jgi:hypothetical protein
MTEEMVLERFAKTIEKLDQQNSDLNPEINLNKLIEQFSQEYKKNPGRKLPPGSLNINSNQLPIRGNLDFGELSLDCFAFLEADKALEDACF